MATSRTGEKYLRLTPLRCLAALRILDRVRGAAAIKPDGPIPGVDTVASMLEEHIQALLTAKRRR